MSQDAITGPPTQMSHPHQNMMLPPTPNDLLAGRYRLVRKVAEGGTSVVYQAFDNIDQQWRAIKVLNQEFTKRQTIRARFENESKMMMVLEHKNIVRVYDAGSDGDKAYLVMDYAEGGSVIDWVAKHGKMPPRLATRVAIELCEGIRYAHDMGVIHRDVKPQNLLVDRNGVCKVTDFGIAQVNQETRVTMTGTVMGTIGYMAPEQHESAKHADERADVYSIAATIYTLVHGEAATHLFMADDRDYDGIPEPLAEVIKKGSQYRKEMRYDNVGLMAQQFAAALDRLPPDPPATPPLVDPAEVTLPKHPDSRKPPPELDARDGGFKPTGLNIDRTPSSIIPRDSLTGAQKIRRPRVKNRDEIERAHRVRLVAIGIGAGVALFGLVLLGCALYGRFQLEYAERHETAASSALYDQLLTETRLLELDNLKQPSELEELFETVRTDWSTLSPEQRIGVTARIEARITSELEGLERSPGSFQATVKQLKEASRQIERSRRDYADRSEEVHAVSDTVFGWLGRAIPDLPL